MGGRDDAPADRLAARTILVVEDDAGDRAMVRRFLRSQPREFEILEAATGAEGLALCRSRRPDCVLLDYYLPDMDGGEFLDALRADAHDGPSLAVAVLTGTESDTTATAALNRGAHDYVVKDSITASGLARVIENALEKFHIRRELDEHRSALERQNRRLELLRDELQAKMLELASATKAKDRFLAVMSHEMRTPLNAILGYADLLDMGLDGDLTDMQRQHLERMRVGSRHLLELINDVLDLTRADVQKLDVDLRPVDAAAVIEEVVALLGRQAVAQGVQLTVEGCEPGPPRVHADLQRLRQVLMNLVGNAIKFTDHGSVRIRCRRRADSVEIDVADTGIGIDPEVLPLVFNEFYQARGELTRPHGGSGLGLAISQRLANLMGGEIRVVSAPGRGSTFTLTLKAASDDSALRADDVAAHDAQMAAHLAGGVAHAPSVTVVAFGDDRQSLEELEQRVRRSVRLAWTMDSDEVPSLARENDASLVVLDVGSADGAAWRAAHALQEHADLLSVPVLLLPSLNAAMPDDASSQVLDLGWVSLVPKPFTAGQLTHAVAVAASSRGADGTEGAPPSEVLVVDDDPDSRRVASRFLIEAGVRVREAEDGEGALAEMRAEAPDVVVLDLMMPVLDGFGVLAAMRADAQLAGIPAVVLTAKTLTEAEREFLSRTAIRVLQKGEHRLADVASLVLRAAAGVRS